MTLRKPFVYVCIFVFVTWENVVQSSICGNEGDTAAISQVRLKVYRGTDTNYTITESTVKNPERLASVILADRDTVLYIHGWTDNPDKPIVKMIMEAYLARGNTNFIMTDWSNIAMNSNYVYVSQNVHGVGKAIAETMNKLADVINFSTFHVVGHSLGAHVGGYVGRYLNTTLNRLTGLDPAFPLFYPSSCHIRPTDAQIVVALHTDAGISGTPYNTADVDFYANNGLNPQPGCLPLPVAGDYCSHHRAVKFYAESLIHPKAFPAHPCCDRGGQSDMVVYFGDSVPKNTRGEYCFRTNAQPPYGKGV